MKLTNHRVECPDCGDVNQPSTAAGRRKYGLAIALVFVLFFGVGIGGTIGIATAGAGISAVVPLGIIGGWVGWRSGVWAARVRDGVNCTACGYDYTESGLKRRLRNLRS